MSRELIERDASLHEIRRQAVHLDITLVPGDHLANGIDNHDALVSMGQDAFHQRVFGLQFAFLRREQVEHACLLLRCALDRVTFARQ